MSDEMFQADDIIAEVIELANRHIGIALTFGKVHMQVYSVLLILK
jgi:hypothetical protein